ncbi:hypothetical protein Thermo_00047 [Thermoplasmatales archaeon]|nr:hypothetical protein Thermo_00047 [Thermoplasmatales archaeon]
MKNRSPQGNNIIPGFPADVPIIVIISTGNLSPMNSLKVKFKPKDGVIYDDIANFINSSNEKAYLQLKSTPAK